MFDCFVLFDNHYQHMHGAEYYARELSGDNTRQKDVVIVYAALNYVVRYEESPLLPRYLSDNNIKKVKAHLKRTKRLTLKWAISAAQNAIRYMVASVQGVSNKMIELPCKKFFELMFTNWNETADQLHHSLMDRVNALLDEDIVAEVKWPWSTVYGKSSMCSFKVYIIWGCDTNFVAKFGNVFYVGFTFQLGLTRVMGCSYRNAKLKQMLDGSCYCACICAIDFDSAGNDFVKFRKCVFDMERKNICYRYDRQKMNENLRLIPY